MGSKNVSGRHAASPRRSGFTLLELIMVVIIIAVIAGLVIPQISMMGRSADMAATAKTQADLANNLSTYFVLQKRWPRGMDSLLVGDGLTPPTEAFFPNGSSSTQTTGLPNSGPHLDRSLAMINLADDSQAAITGKVGFNAMAFPETDRTGFGRSITRGGFDFVYDHDVSVLNANDSAKFTAPRRLDRTIGGDGCWVAVVDEGDWDGNGRTGLDLIRRIMPASQLVDDGDGNLVLPPDQILVAMGIGPNNDMLSKTLSSTPIYPGNEGTYYGRYVAIFKIYASGERPTLVAVVDSYGRDPDYTQKQFNESLPDDARQG